MASKNRATLEKEAAFLELDSSVFETNAQFEEAIAAKRAELEADESEEAKKKLEELDALEPVKGSATPKDNEVKEDKKDADVSFETTEYVEMHVGKKKYAGRNFTFPADVVEDRKRILRENYGEGIIK